MSLPVEAYLGEIRSSLREKGKLLLSAAPGAGKTTCVPGALAEEFPEGRIIMVEPRRVAASAAAVRISALHGTALGEFAGFVVRGEKRFNKATRVLVMTPGVLLRKLQSDPALEDTAVVIFDEFHERSLECDLLFSLILESCKAFREDLKLLIMSATLNTSVIQKVPEFSTVLEIPGREFPVEQLWQHEICLREKIVPAMARAVLEMLPKSEGNVLAFFPGVAEIRNCRKVLESALPDTVLLEELHGSLSLGEQSSVLSPAPAGKRKVVLATNVAESSLTVDNVRCVIDCGYERNPRYNAASGLTFLETEAISQASAAQRSGRAGRTAPGIALRLWDVHSHEGRKSFKKPEICDADLTALALEIALWGARKEELVWLDVPPESSFAEALKLLQQLGALDKEGHPTSLGREIARYPVHPRLGAILAAGIKSRRGYLAAEIASLLENRTDTAFPAESDLTLHIEYLRKNIKKHRSHQQLLEQLVRIAGVPEQFHDSDGCGELLAAGFPDRLGHIRRPGKNGFTLRNGRGGKLPEGEVLPASEFIVAAETGGKSSGDGTIFKYASVAKEYVLEKYSSEITERRVCSFDTDSGKIFCRKESLLGAIVLSSTPVPPEVGEVAQGVFDAALKRGIPLIPESDKGGRALRERILFARRNDPEEFPECDDVHLAETAWSYFPELKTLAQLEKLTWVPVLRALLGESTWEKLQRLYPEKFRTPAGAEHRIDYSRDVPVLAVKLQEMLGVVTHPVTGLKKIPLRIELLSPALRPIQTTSDLPGFWKGSYALVRKEMKARYPKHEWPENPAEAPPMLRSIKRKGE